MYVKIKYKMVEEYKKTCDYRLSTLKNRIYLYDEIKTIEIDGDRAFISGLTEHITLLAGHSISFEENVSLDERYRFNKVLKISVNGRLDISTLPDKLYAIIETKEGDYFFTNPDFPYFLTYEFNLSDGVCQTDITLSCASNFPTLELKNESLPDSAECKTYNTNNIVEFDLLEKNKVSLNTLSRDVLVTGQWKNIEYLKNTFTLNESYDGYNTRVRIDFNIPLSSYKGDWQYKLLEFTNNLYVAKIKAEDGLFYFAGYYNGLQPTYIINASMEEIDNVHIVLIEASSQGLWVADSINETVNTNTYWKYVAYIGDVKTYECNGMGWARYLMMAEVDYLDNYTGNYDMNQEIWDCLHDDDPDVDHSYCWDNYGHLLNYNIVGIFPDYYNNKYAPGTNYFPTSECAYQNVDDECELTTDLPNTIVFNATGSSSYTISSTCDWSVVSFPPFVTVAPASGAADETYTITINNTATPTEYAQDGVITISNGDNTINVNVSVITEASCVTPTSTTINCLQQNVKFFFQSFCPVYVDSVKKDNVDYDGVLITLDDGTLTANVPANNTSQQTVYKIFLENCGCSEELTEIDIIQDKQYTEWRVDDTEYICSGTSKYEKEYFYTGTTSTSLEKTDIFRMGALISEESADCSRQTRYVWLGHYICIDGAKYKILEEQESLDDGETWTETGHVMLGEFIEEESEFCDQEITYTWRLSKEWICE